MRTTKLHFSFFSPARSWFLAQLICIKAELLIRETSSGTPSRHPRLVHNNPSPGSTVKSAGRTFFLFLLSQKLLIGVTVNPKPERHRLTFSCEERESCVWVKSSTDGGEDDVLLIPRAGGNSSGGALFRVGTAATRVIRTENTFRRGGN